MFTLRFFVPGVTLLKFAADVHSRLAVPLLADGFVAPPSVTLLAWNCGTASFVHTITATRNFSVFVNVHVTVSPGARLLTVAFRVPVSVVTVLVPSADVHCRLLNTHPCTAVSVTEYATPGVSGPLSFGVSVSFKLNPLYPLPVVVKLKLDGSPLGCVTLSTTIFPDFVFVYVHATLSLWAKLMLAVRVCVLVVNVDVPAAEVHCRVVSAYPVAAGSFSVTV
jgi:hypothetical protein